MEVIVFFQQTGEERAAHRHFDSQDSLENTSPLHGATYTFYVSRCIVKIDRQTFNAWRRTRLHAQNSRTSTISGQLVWPIPD